MTDRERELPTRDCVAAEEIGAVLERDPGDARRRHVDSCPRCRALARELTSFLGDPPLSAADAGMVTALERALREEIVAPGRERAAWWRSATGRPALAAAAVFLAVVVAIPLLNRNADEGIVLRGTGEPAPSFAGRPVAAARGEGGTRVIEFGWSAQAEADAYRVEVYDAALARIATVEAGASTSVRWSEADAALPSGAVPAAWRVVGLEHGDPVVRSGFLPYPVAGADAGR